MSLKKIKSHIPVSEGSNGIKFQPIKICFDQLIDIATKTHERAQKCNPVLERFAKDAFYGHFGDLEPEKGPN